MTQQEFESRVKMQVSCEEYQHIENVYLDSDVDKDEFCRLWAKMNHERVFKAREEQKRIAGLQALNERVWNIYEKYAYRDASWKMNAEPVSVLTARETKIIKQLNLEGYKLMLNDCYYNYNMGCLLWEIQDYLKKQMEIQMEQR